MKRLTTLCLAGLTALVLALPAGAATNFKHAKAGVQLDVPDNWKASAGEGDVLNLKAEDEGINISVWAVDAADLDKAVEALDEELGKVLKDVKQDGKAEPIKVNDLQGSQASGSATVDGHEVQWAVAVIMADHPVIVMGFGNKDSIKAHHDEIQAIFQSIRRL